MKPLDILIVDDDTDFAEGLSSVLKIEGHRITVAGSGEEALEIYKKGTFDVTFMDVMLPGINGVETFSEIKKEFPSALIIIMTGYAVENLLEQTAEGGASRILRKPFSLDEVLASIQDTQPAGFVLIADDDPDFTEGVAQFLSSKGYRVRTASTGSEALDMAMDESANMLILDLKLPILHGLGVYMELKKRGRCLPIIIVTGYPQDETESLNTLRSMSATGCLFKPFELEELFQAICEAGKE